jgi:nucleotide-binding universal stress UspA family protein
MKILLAVDGSRYTKKMLAYLATREFFSQGHDYTVLTVQPKMSLRVQAAVGKGAMATYYTEEVEKILAPVSKFLLRHGINAKSSWKTGPVGSTIARFAEDGKFDLLIMGSHGHGTVVNLVMGSVATKVLAECKVPVLLMR